MTHRVLFSSKAQEQLTDLYRHIAQVASPVTAASYTEAIVSYCESLSRFPHRGTLRDDVEQKVRKKY